jgi:hypothetical protein
MDVTVFYAWQDDRPGKCNRRLIADAAEAACKRITDDPANDFVVRLDQDTVGRPGMCDIPNTILEKIRRCDVLLADLTFAGRTDAEAKHHKQISNPNVLMELGYAVGCKATDESDGFERVIGVMNVAYGKPEEQMFDIKRRRPITYELPEESDKDQLQRVTKSLSKSIEDALRTILNEAVLPAKGEAGAKRFQDIRDQFEASVRDGSFHGLCNEFAAVAVCLVADIPANLDHEALQQLRLPLVWTPEGEQQLRGNSVLTVREWPGNDPGQRYRISIAEIRVDGTILAADTLNLHPHVQKQDINDGRTIPPQELECEVVKAVTRYANVLHSLNVPGPWRLGMSLLNVGGYRMLPPRHSPAAYRLARGDDDVAGEVPAGTPDLVGPEIRISGFEVVASEESVSQVLKDTFDFLSRECGFPGSFRYSRP